MAAAAPIPGAPPVNPNWWDLLNNEHSLNFLKGLNMLANAMTIPGSTGDRVGQATGGIVKDAQGNLKVRQVNAEAQGARQAAVKSTLGTLPVGAQGQAPAAQGATPTAQTTPGIDHNALASALLDQLSGRVAQGQTSTDSFANTLAPVVPQQNAIAQAPQAPQAQAPQAGTPSPVATPANAPAVPMEAGAANAQTFDPKAHLQQLVSQLFDSMQNGKLIPFNGGVPLSGSDTPPNLSHLSFDQLQSVYGGEDALRKQAIEEKDLPYTNMIKRTNAISGAMNTLDSLEQSKNLQLQHAMWDPQTGTVDGPNAKPYIVSVNKNGSIMPVAPLATQQTEREVTLYNPETKQNEVRLIGPGHPPAGTLVGEAAKPKESNGTFTDFGDAYKDGDTWKQTRVNSVTNEKVTIDYPSDPKQMDIVGSPEDVFDQGGRFTGVRVIKKNGTMEFIPTSLPKGNTTQKPTTGTAQESLDIQKARLAVTQAQKKLADWRVENKVGLPVTGNWWGNTPPTKVKEFEKLKAESTVAENALTSILNRQQTGNPTPAPERLAPGSLVVEPTGQASSPSSGSPLDLYMSKAGVKVQ